MYFSELGSRNGRLRKHVGEVLVIFGGQEIVLHVHRLLVLLPDLVKRVSPKPRQIFGELLSLEDRSASLEQQPVQMVECPIALEVLDNQVHALGGRQQFKHV